MGLVPYRASCSSRSRPRATWPIEIRAEAIAVFFAVAQIFGALGPLFYGALSGDGSSRTGLFIGYLVGAGIMIFGGIIEIIFGIDAEGKSLEEVTKPLTSTGEPERPSGGDTRIKPGLRQYWACRRSGRRARPSPYG